MQEKNKAYSFLLIVFCIIYILIRIPNFYLFFQSPYFLSHSIARGLILVFTLFQIKKLIQIKKLPSSTLYITLYFVGVSLSIVSIVNVGSFFTVYKDVIFSLLLFFNTFILIQKEDVYLLLKLFAVLTVVMLLSEVLILLYPTVILPVFTSILHESYLQFFQYQFGRERWFVDSLNEAFLPVIAFIILNRKTNIGHFLILLFAVISIVFITFISGSRTKLVICIFSSVFTLFIFYKRKLRVLLLSLLALVVIILTTLSIISSGIKMTSSLERLLNIDGPELQENISRTSYLKDAFEIGSSLPLFGVGLGNYYDVLLQTSKNKSKNYAENIYSKKFIAIDDPHNILLSAYASTGLIGIVGLISLLLYFFIMDLSSFQTLPLEGKSLVITFWSVFIYAFFNPWMYFQYMALFWLIRGVTEKIHYLSVNKNE